MIRYVPGVGYVQDVAGTDRQVVMGSAEEQAMSQNFQDQHNAFMDSVVFKQNRDYRDTWDKLFGAQPASTGYSPMFGSGPQDRWQGAMTDRLKLRREGKFDDVGYYERYAQYSDQDWQRNMYERNNAIEEMYRRGYDMGQINDYLSGKRNVLEEGPSWKDYYSEKEKAGEGINWTDGYFIGAPDQDRGGYVGQRISAALDTLADRINKSLSDRGIAAEQTPATKRNVTSGLFGKYINKGQE